MDSKFVTADLGELQNELHGISSKWYDLGVQLHIDSGELDNIKRDNPVECLREMLKIWLKKVDPDPTWNALIDALKSRVINEQKLANQLERKYMTDGVIPSAPAIQSVSGATASSATPVSAVPQTSTSQTSNLQLQSQARRQPAPEQTGPKPGSVAGVKQISFGVADQVSKATEIPTIKTIDVKQPVIDEQQLDDHLQKKYTIDGVTPSATTIQSVPGSHVLIATTPIPAVPAMPQASQQTGAKQVSRGGTKQVSVGGAKLGGADQVNKGMEIPITISPTAHKRGSSRSEMSGSKRPKTAADVVGSYTCEFVSQPPDDLLCQKCNYVAKEPQQMKCCGALYCKSCLAGATSNAASHRLHCCVKCKSRSLDHFFDRKSNEQIQKLMVKCTNLDEGCDWTGELKDLDGHRSQCPKEEIPCTLSDVGCQKRLLREDLDNHITQDQQQHLHCAVTSILRLRQELATTQGELREVQETLSKCMDDAQTLPMTFKMSNYAKFKKERDTWYSTPFYSRRSECRFRLRVQPQQPGWNRPETISFALEVLASSEPYTSLKVEVLNQASDAAHLSFTPSAFSTFNFRGCGQIVELPTSPPFPGPGELRYQNTVQYLYRNCLFFRVSECEKPWLNHAKKL